jgi:hypothetical protein
MVKARRNSWKCGDCGAKFSVTVGTILENSRLSLEKWALALDAVCASPIGVLPADLQVQANVSRRTAYSLFARIYLARATPSLSLVWKRALKCAAKTPSPLQAAAQSQLQRMGRLPKWRDNERVSFSHPLSLWPLPSSVALREILSIRPFGL